MRLLAVVVLVAACATTPRPPPTAWRVSRVEEPKPMPTPLDGLGTNIVDAFSGDNLVYYWSAIITTGVLVLSDVDHEVHVRFGRNYKNGAWNETANIAAYVLPVVVALTIFAAGHASGNRMLTGAGSAAIQAFVVTMATTGALKFATGRPYPVNHEALDESDHARELRPGQHGIGSWPSGHTSGTISIAAALTAYAPEQHWIPLVGYSLALGIGLGMVERDSHWVSDFTAGALIGHAIGYSIGRNFRKRVRGERIVTDTFEVVPLTVTGGAGLALSGSW